MPYKADSFKASLVWGRIGAAVMALLAFILGFFGFTLAPDDQASLVDLGAAFLAGIAGVMAIVSKLREKKKAED